jgi:alanine dehydrogenase
MKVGVPKEIKEDENRISLLPSSVKELVGRGHEVFVESGAGLGVGMMDDVYIQSGAKIVPSAAEIFGCSDMVVKVKEPQRREWEMLRKGQVLFTYLHLAPDCDQTRGLMNSGCSAVAYETITGQGGGLPLLAPMSEVAGRMAAYVGSQYLAKVHGGKGILLGGVAGVRPAKVTVIGGGMSGTNAVAMLVGMGADVTVIDRNMSRLRDFDAHYKGRVKTEFSTMQSIEENVLASSLVIGTVLIPGETAPKLVTREMIGSMEKGSVVVDVAVDQGGCFETTRATTHHDPVYEVDGVVHYCVANMPGAYPRTSSEALNNATLPYVLKLADKGLKDALEGDVHMMSGLNVCAGEVCYEAVAQAHGFLYVDAREALASLV